MSEPPAPAPASARNARAERQALIGIVASIVSGVAMAAAGAGNGSHVVSWGSVFVVCVVLAYVVNWAAFVPAYRAQTERFYDITGTATYLAMVGVAIVWGSSSMRARLLAVLVAVWTLRLGLFLLRRIRQDGSDGRFDDLKPSFVRFLAAWTMQALWCVMTVACALAAMTSTVTARASWTLWVGLAVWMLGFSIEVVADAQKRAFRADSANAGRFITSGLWAWSRHPNYFGEIVLWVGVAIIASPVLRGWQYATLISPVFVYLLLTRVSGIPLLEARAERRWSDDDHYRRYVAETPVLVPRPPRSAGS